MCVCMYVNYIYVCIDIICVYIYIYMSIYIYIYKEPIGGKSLLHFLENIASAQHFQPLLEEDDEVLQSDCAMFCSVRLW